MASLSGVFNLQNFTDLGAFAVGGRLYTYAPGTTTHKTAFTEASGVVSHSYVSDGSGGLYIAMNARGELPAPLFLTSGGYDIKYATAAGATVWTRRASGSDDALFATLTDLADIISAAKGAGLVGYNPSLAYAGATVGGALNQQPIRPQSYGAVGDGSTDDTTAIQTALTNAGTSGRPVHIPGVTTFYRITNELTVPDNVFIYGDGYRSCIKQETREKNLFASGSKCEFRTLRLQGDGVVTGGISFTKNNGISIVGKHHVKVLECWIHGFEFNGVFTDDSSNLTINGCIFYGQPFSIGSGSDITLYSDVGGSRTSITNNFLLSNNSQGVWVNALGKDSDILVSGNIAASLDASWALVTSGALARRHGYILGYLGGTGSGRIICTGNHSYYTRQTGVYWQGASTTDGSAVISNNYIRSAGINPTDPSLAAGIFLGVQGPADIVEGNIIDSMPVTGYITAAGISLLPSATGVPTGNNTTIRGNSIYNTGAHGIYVGARAQNVVVESNTVSGAGEAYYIYVGNGVFTAVGTLSFINNRGYGLTAAKSGMEVNLQGSTPSVIVRGNDLTGFNNSTATTVNCGLSLADWSAVTVVSDNSFKTFYGGVSSGAYCNVNSSVRFNGNRFISCNAAYHVATTGAGKAIGQGDILSSTSTYQSAALLAGLQAIWPGVWLSSTQCTVKASAAPTVGTWVVGDRAENIAPAGGAFKAYSCTVAGYAGTWVSEGLL